MLELEICYANVELTPEQMASLCGISQKDGFACAFMDDTVIGTRASA